MKDDKKKGFNVITGDYSEYKKRYEQLIPEIKEQFREEKIPFPEDPWELFNEVMFRNFDGDNKTLNFDDFLEASIKMKKERAKKIQDRFIYEKIQSPEVQKRIKTFVKTIRTQEENVPHYTNLLKVLEIILHERPGFNVKKDFKATLKAIEDYKEYQESGISYVMKKQRIKEYLKFRERE